MAAQQLLQARQPPLEHEPVEPGGELGEAGEDDVGAGGLELLAGAPTGQHRDAGDAGGPCTLDVVDVVADVDVGVVPRQHLALARSPDAALDHVHVEPEVVDVQLGVGGVLAGDQDDAAAVPAYGGQGLGHAGQGRGRLDRQAGVDLAEPVGGRVDPLGREVGLEQHLERRAQLAGHLRGRELDAELGPERVQGDGEADGGVDQRHVEVEPDHQLLRHCFSVRARADRLPLSLGEC